MKTLNKKMKFSSKKKAFKMSVFVFLQFPPREDKFLAFFGTIYQKICFKRGPVIKAIMLYCDLFMFINFFPLYKFSDFQVYKNEIIK